MMVVVPIDAFPTKEASIHAFSVLTETIKKRIAIALQTMIAVNEEGLP